MARVEIDNDQNWSEHEKIALTFAINKEARKEERIMQGGMHSDKPL